VTIAITAVKCHYSTPVGNVHPGRIGQNDVVNVTGPITIISNGTYADSDASIKANTQVTAGSITITTAKHAYLGDNTVITTTGAVNLTSTGSYTESNAMLNAGCHLTASDLRVEASKSAFVGENAVVQVSNSATIISRDASSGSQAMIKSGGSVSGASLSITSGNKATLGVSSAVNVTGNFNMSGTNCSIATSATITTGSTTGTCFPHASLMPNPTILATVVSTNTGVSLRAGIARLPMDVPIAYYDINTGKPIESGAPSYLSEREGEPTQSNDKRGA
jgi:hypothetical protein